MISNASLHLITILAVEVLGGFEDGQVQLGNSSRWNFWVSLGQVIHKHPCKTWAILERQLFCAIINFYLPRRLKPNIQVVHL